LQANHKPDGRPPNEGFHTGLLGRTQCRRAATPAHSQRRQGTKARDPECGRRPVAPRDGGDRANGSLGTEVEGLTGMDHGDIQPCPRDVADDGVRRFGRAQGSQRLDDKERGAFGRYERGRAMPGFRQPALEESGELGSRLAWTPPTRASEHSPWLRSRMAMSSAAPKEQVSSSMTRLGPCRSKRLLSRPATMLSM
jgi:hypothetical protein